jgi:hypothetical protein
MSEAWTDLAAVGLDKARELLDASEWYVRELIKRGELESYLDGRTRKVTVRSIKARQDRLLQAQTPAATIPPPPRRGRPCNHPASADLTV